VVARERTVDGLVEADLRLDGLAAVVLVSAAYEDVVDAPVGLAERRGEGVVPRVRGPGAAVARERERVLKIDAPPLCQGGQAAEVADLVGVGLGVQVADEQRRKRERSIATRERLDAVDDLEELRRPDVAFVELPVEVRDEERDCPEGRRDLGEEKRPSVPTRGSS
jgi:hypothetical protein